MDEMSDEELNEAIALEVLGWKRGSRPGEYPWIEVARGRRLGREYPPDSSTNIEAAWKVVKKMGPMWMDATAPELGIDVEFTEGCKATAPTAPRAICLAALKAARAATQSEDHP